MKRFFPELLLILVIGCLSYSSYVMHNAVDNTKVADQFMRFLEKKEQQKAEVNDNERINELQLDIEEIATSMEEHTVLNEKLLKAHYAIDVSIVLGVLALYFMLRRKVENQ